ncbi:MAG TPA: hypothetical protein VJT73_18400 [Polyangiaceae bacterium]|nr:hypothetical protein [Polyangiaceae bacterium]
MKRGGGVGRRDVLGAPFALLFCGRAAAASAEPFRVIDLRVGSQDDPISRAKVIVPEAARATPKAALGATFAGDAGATSPKTLVLVLFHGLGETTDETAGVGAWSERYGLLTSYQRLRRPPVAFFDGRGALTRARAGEIDRELARRPFRGNIVFACPFTPNVWKFSHREKGMARIADWTISTLLPEVLSKAGIAAGEATVAVGGCSLGGFVALEVFLRRPASFTAFSGVQSALGKAHVARWATRIEEAVRRVGPRRLLFETSRRDPFLDANRVLAIELGRRKVPHDFVVAPGPHDQAWLREVGTLEMLLWHDRAR